MEYGWIMLIILSIMGGIIAYIGDKLGSRIGKRKIVLFGLRPKYTSILVTIITGISIAVVTLGVMSVLSQNVRTALFGIHQLQLQKSELEAQRDQLLQQAEELSGEMRDKNALLAANEEQLANQEKQLRMSMLDLEQARAARDDLSRQKDLIQVALDEKSADLSQKNGEIADLEATKSNLTKNIAMLDQRIKMMNEVLQNVREGTVLFRVGEVLSSSVLDGGQNDEKTHEALSTFLSQTNTYIRQHLGIKDEKAVLLYVSQDEFDAVTEQLKNSSGKKLVRTIAAGNIILGEPALVHVQIYDNNLIYNSGDIVYAENLKQSDLSNNVELQLMRFLHNVNQQAQAKGLLPDPLTGNVGALTATEMFDAINKIKASPGGAVRLEAVTTRDIYTAGPLQIELVVQSAQL